MSKRKGHASPASPAGSRSGNPIIAAMQRTFSGRATVMDGAPPHVFELMIRGAYGDEVIREVGILIIKSLMLGDQRIIKTVEDAIKESDHIFKRDRERVLVERVKNYLPSLWSSGLDIVAIKKEIEKRSNKGKPLHQYQWSRIRDALSLANLPTGASAPAYVRKSSRKSGTKRRQSVS
jgi:hypothetical protein